MASRVFDGSSALWLDTQSVSRGIGLVADALKPTLGPRVDAIRIGMRHNSPDDKAYGLILAEAVGATHGLEVLGTSIIDAAATKTNEEAGDGAAVTAILAQTIADQSKRAIERGVDPFGLQRGIDLAVNAVLGDIRRQAAKVSAGMYEHVATISADGDSAVGGLVGRALIEAGGAGKIRVNEFASDNPYLKMSRRKGIHWITIGASTEAERQARRQQVEMSVRAIEAALAQGVVAGGGAALLHARRALDRLPSASADQLLGIDIVRQALAAPIRQLVENADVNSTSVVESLSRESNVRVGYDVSRFNYMDMVGAGIVDTARSVGAALRNGAAVAAGITTIPAQYIFAGRVQSAKRNPYFRQVISNFSASANEPKGFSVGEAAPSGPSFDAVHNEAAGTTGAPTRYLVGDCPEQVETKKEFALRVYLSLTDIGTHKSAIKDLVVPPEGLKLDITVHAESFDFKTATHLPISVPQNGESTVATFVLVAGEPGKRFIRLSAFNGGTCIGGLTIPLEICKAGELSKTGRQKAQDPVDKTAVDPEGAILIIEYRNEEYAFRWRDAPDGPERESQYLGKTLNAVTDVIEDVIKKIQSLAKGKYSAPAEVADEMLKGWGINLWETLIPEKIRERFISEYRKGTLKRLRITSAGDPFPWEMLYPFEKGEAGLDENFLVNLVELSRWTFGSRPPSEIVPRRADFVVPSKDLKDAESEAASLSTMLREWNASLEDHRVTNLKELYALLRSARIGLLHFACHNSVDADGGGITLDSTPITPDGLGGYEDKLKTAAPLVFLNACRTDTKPPRYTRVGGWANCFLFMGAGAFMGTLWEVRDTTARQFAEEFYKALLQRNESFGQAMRSARTEARRLAPADPTWLAYSFYGAPDARLSGRPPKT